MISFYNSNYKRKYLGVNHHYYRIIREKRFRVVIRNNDYVIKIKNTSYLCKEGDYTRKPDFFFSKNYNYFNLDIFNYFFFFFVYRVVTTLLMHSIAWKTGVLL